MNYSGKIKVKKLHPDAKIPEFKTEGSVAADLYSVEDVCLQPFRVTSVDTGLAMESLEHFWLQIEGRSGMAASLSTFPVGGIIDEDYRGPIKVLLYNGCGSLHLISKGDRIAQLVQRQSIRFPYEESSELSNTVRGASGFGSTGR